MAVRDDEAMRFLVDSLVLEDGHHDRRSAVRTATGARELDLRRGEMTPRLVMLARKKLGLLIDLANHTLVVCKPVETRRAHAQIYLPADPIHEATAAG